MGPGTLTPRQRDVLTLVAKGLTNSEIASALEVSTSTVKSHVESILRALGVTNRTEAAALASGIAEEASTSCLRLTSAPAVAVLRFDVVPGDELARIFASGLADDLIMLLCKWRWFPVIARSTSFFYGSDRPAAELGRLMEAAYLVGGTVAYSDGQLRVSARLDDARRDWCLWSERFELPAGDVFALQDEIATVIVGRLYPEILKAEGRLARATPPGLLSAWQLSHDGLLLMERGQNAESQRALQLFDDASRQDPHYVLPIYGKGMGLAERIFNQWSDQIAEHSAELQRCAERAIDIDPNDAAGWTMAGRGALMAGDARSGIEALDRATTLNPCHAKAQAWLGLGRVCANDRGGFTNLKLAARLSPRAQISNLALAYFAVAEYAEAISTCHHALTRSAGAYGLTQAILCASYALGGDEVTARAELVRLRQKAPGYSLENWYRMAPRGNHDVPDRIAEGLRRAGLDS